MLVCARLCPEQFDAAVSVQPSLQFFAQLLLKSGGADGPTAAQLFEFPLADDRVLCRQQCEVIQITMTM